MQMANPTLVMTRPEPSGTQFALRVVEAMGRPVQTIISPLIRIEMLDISVSEAPTALVLTSVNGAIAAGRMGLPASTRAFCVGDRTATEAQAQGFEPLSAEGDSAKLVELIRQTRPDGPLLHLHGAHKTGNVAEDLTEAGIPCAGLVAYQQHAQSLTAAAKTALSGETPVLLPLFSPRTASILLESGPFTAPITAIALSQSVADVAVNLRPKRLIIAGTPDAETMCRATYDAFAAI